jgi:hypothetical protein
MYRSDVKTLARRIESELQVGDYNHCAIYEHGLKRLWPIDDPDREKKIAKNRAIGFPRPTR